jgi:hypothetical protein
VGEIRNNDDANTWHDMPEYKLDRMQHALEQANRPVEPRESAATDNPISERRSDIGEVIRYAADRTNVALGTALSYAYDKAPWAFEQTQRTAADVSDALKGDISPNLALDVGTAAYKVAKEFSEEDYTAHAERTYQAFLDLERDHGEGR